MKTKSFPVLALALVALMSFTAVAEAATWVIDPNHSVLRFKVRHFFSKAGGGFADWSGTIEFDAENVEAGSVEVMIKTASVDTDNEDRDNHLRSPDFFDAENHPVISFKSTEVKEKDGGLELVGDLTMKGITKQVAIPFEFHGAGPDMWGGTRAGFSGKLVIDRKDFGIEWNANLDKGGVVLGEEVDIELEIEAMLEQDKAEG